jgi:hypothetical protein
MGIYHGRRRNSEKRAAEAKAEFDALSPKQQRFQRAKEYWSLSNSEWDRYQKTVQPIIAAELEHMQQQGYVSPFMTFDQAMDQIEVMLHKEYGYDYCNTQGVRVHTLQQAYVQGGKKAVLMRYGNKKPANNDVYKRGAEAAVIVSFAELMNEANDCLLERIENSYWLGDVHEAAAVIAPNLILLENRGKKITPITFSGTLTSEFPKIWADERNQEIKVAMDKAYSSLSSVLGCSGNQPLSDPTPQELVDVSERDGLSFTGLPDQYVEMRLRAKGLRLYVPSETPAPTGNG